MDEEKTIWEGSPSQILNLPVFILCGLAVGVLIGSAILLRDRINPGVSYALAAAAIVSVAIALLKYVQLKCLRYRITTERLHVRRGIFSHKTDDVELYRVKDYALIEPFTLRLFGLGDLLLATDDEANPRVVLKAIPQVNTLRDEIRKHVELCRDKKRVRVTEFQ